MKVKDLIKELQKTSPENTVYLDDGSLSYDRKQRNLVHLSFRNWPKPVIK